MKRADSNNPVQAQRDGGISNTLPNDGRDNAPYRSLMHSNDLRTSSSERKSTLRFFAAIILAAGLAVAAFVYPHGNGGSGDDESTGAEMPLSLQDSRRDSRELEIESGKLGVLVNRWMEVGKAWTQPKPLAITKKRRGQVWGQV